MDEDLQCYFCESKENILLPKVGIALGMAGNDYSFCKKCLKKMTAEEFWKEFTETQGYSWPPKLIE